MFHWAGGVVFGGIVRAAQAARSNPSICAGPVGCLRPCSQLRSVPSATPMLVANWLCDKPVCALILPTSITGT